LIFDFFCKKNQKSNFARSAPFLRRDSSRNLIWRSTRAVNRKLIFKQLTVNHLNIEKKHMIFVSFLNHSYFGYGERKKTNILRISESGFRVSD
jgi:hypothetical protein